MQTITHRKILFVFSDPGGAKPCLAIINNLNRGDLTVISDRVYPFYSTFDVEVEFFNEKPSDFLQRFEFDLIFTGTSYTSRLEIDFIELALEKNIPCWSFVDHWTNIKGRFINHVGKLILPDKIWLIDNRAKEIAISEGIPQEIIVISGNPYHTWLKKWESKISKAQFYESLGILPHNKAIVFAFDPLSNINGKKLFGFDEISVIKELANMTHDIIQEHPDWMFLIKPHPNQDVKKLLSVVDKNSLFKVILNELDSNEVIFHADLIIGFFSSFLLEAQIMNKTVLRVLPDDINNDPFVEMNVGVTVNVANLVKQIIINLNKNA